MSFLNKRRRKELFIAIGVLVGIALLFTLIGLLGS
jgi:hypothetical protein